LPTKLKTYSTISKSAQNTQKSIKSHKNTQKTPFPTNINPHSTVNIIFSLPFKLCELRATKQFGQIKCSSLSPLCAKLRDKFGKKKVKDCQRFFFFFMSARYVGGEFASTTKSRRRISASVNAPHSTEILFGFIRGDMKVGEKGFELRILLQIQEVEIWGFEIFGVFYCTFERLEFEH
jgi:hypothetical protein